MELRFMLVNGDFKVHAKGCRAISRDLKTSDYEKPGELTADSQREVTLDLWDDILAEEYPEREFSSLTEQELASCASAISYHTCVKDLPDGWDARVTKREAKQLLAHYVLDGALTSVADFLAHDGGIPEDEARRTVSQWLHHLNAGNGEDGKRYFPEGLPRPDRSDWR